MARIQILDQVVLRCDPWEAFSYLGVEHPEHGSMLGLKCDRLALHKPVELSVGQSDSDVDRRMTLLGRISSLDPPRRLTIKQEMPWQGELICTFTPTTDGTRVRIVASFDESHMASVYRFLGVDIEEDIDDDRVKFGLIMSKSGSGSIFAAATEQLAAMAVDELNQDADLRDHEFQLLVQDDRTDPTEAARATRRLIQSGCTAIMSNVTSLSFEAIQNVASKHGVLIVYTPLNEGGERSHGVFRLGERPADQLVRAVPHIMAQTGSRNWFLAGNRYSWPRQTNVEARRRIETSGGRVVKEEYRNLGTRDFSSLVDVIIKSGADAVLSTFVGADEVAFERQCAESGLRNRVQTMSLALDEATRERVGDDASTGIWTSFGYFESLETVENMEFVHRYRSRYGVCVPPISTISESVYEAVLLVGRAIRASRETDFTSVVRSFRNTTLDTPRGWVDIAQRSRQSTHVARAVPGGFAITA